MTAPAVAAPTAPERANGHDLDARLKDSALDLFHGGFSLILDAIAHQEYEWAEAKAQMARADLARLTDDHRREAIRSLNGLILSADPALQGALFQLLGMTRPDDPTSAPRTDTANGERLAWRYGGRLRYVEAWGWLAWDGRRWARDDNGEIVRLAKETARSIFAEAQAAPTDDEAKKLAAWAVVSQSKQKLEAMAWAAQSEPAIAARPADFDANPWLLNVSNGVIDLRTGELLPHSDSLHLTKLAPVEYNPDAHSDLWTDFLWQIFGENAGLVDFAQRAVGYTLTGNTSEQCLFYCHGAGANGKSTFLETLRALFGDYGQQAEFSTFQERHHSDGPRNDVAGMEGARLVAAIESGEGRKLNEPLIKVLTGQDTVRARYLFKEHFEFHPQFKVWLAANHDPVIRGTDLAIWRRIRKIPFDITFTPERQDKRLAEKLRGELPGVLAWAVRGCLAWQKEGLQPPEEVNQATEAYRVSMDMFAAFLADCCVIREEISARAADLFAAYQRWGGDETQTAFGSRLREHGFIPDRSATGRVWRGLGLLAKADEE